MSEAVGGAVPVACCAVVKRTDEVAIGIRVIALEILQEVPVPAPGQFYQVDCGGGRDHILPRPIGAFDARSAGGVLTLAFLVESVGWGTARLCSLVPGDSIRLLGPLGRGFGAADGKALLVAGGVGLAPLHFLASTMDKAGEPYALLAGFASKDKYIAPLATLKGDVEVFTDDGTMGEKGLVCDAAGPALDQGGFSRVYTCGPELMMAVVAAAAEARGISCEVSLDSRMACGIGACRGCVKPGARGKNLCVCSDGPVFDSREVLWTAK
ncbi:MAG: dihydroorotate dehydrogenase electron transfer subunit [Candidatus Geothermincolia bacterium]